MGATGTVGTVDNSRGIEAILQRMQGPSAVGQLLVHSTSPTGRVPPGAFAIPEAAGSSIDAATVFVTPNPATLDAQGNGGYWDVNSAGVLVNVESVQGGLRPNQAAGTVYRWDDPIDGIELTSMTLAGVVGGDFGGELGGRLRFVGQYKQFSKVDAQSLFQAQAYEFPAAVISWESSQPSDGPMQSSPGPRTVRVGSMRMIWRHVWSLFLITSRADTAGNRRREGERLRDDALEILSDCVSARGLWVSMSPGIEVLESRAYGISPTSYVDVVRFATHIVIRHRPAVAVYNPWEMTRVTVSKAVAPPAPAINLGDVKTDMDGD